jgi:hypothetical protein
MGPDGRQAYVMRCSGMGRSLADCYQKAGELCPAGYDVVGGQSGSVGAGTVIALRTDLVVQCR